MPDLGKYAAEVLSAYVVTIVLMVVLVIVSLRQSAVTRQALRKVEAARQGAAKSGREAPKDG